MGSLGAKTGSVVVLERVDGRWPGVTATVVGERNGHTMVDLGFGIAHGIDADLDVVVSTVAADQMWRQRAHAHRTGELVELVPDGEAQNVCRRTRPRRRVSVPVALVDFDSDIGPVALHGNTVDIGPGGARVWVPQALPPGSDPTLWMTVAPGTRLVVEATAVERIPLAWGFEYRLVFRYVDSATEAALEEFARGEP